MQIGIQTHEGDRVYQEDLAGFDSFGRTRALLVLADGMGGKAGGRFAAEIAVADIPRIFRRARRAFPTREEQFKRAFAGANGEMMDRLARLGCAGGGCAVTVAYARPDAVWFGHVGDVAGLVVRPGLPLPVHRTTPHRASRHLLTRAMGRSDLDVEVSPGIPLLPGDWIILASDGVADALDEARILDLASSANGPRDLADRLVSEALSSKSSGRDNATALVMRA